MVDYIFTDNSGTFIKARTDAVDANTNNFTVLEVNDQPGGITTLSAALQNSIGKTLDIGTIGDLSLGASIGYLKALANTLGLNLTAYPVGSANNTPVLVVSQQLTAPTLTAATGTGASGTTHESWPAVTNATNYVLDRATNNGFTTGVTLGVYSGPLLVFVDSGLTPSTTYYYRVRAQGTNYVDSAESTVQSAAAHA